eukprot:2675625-Karenia_brevis.AAC.2
MCPLRCFCAKQLQPRAVRRGGLCEPCKEVGANEVKAIHDRTSIVLDSADVYSIFKQDTNMHMSEFDRHFRWVWVDLGGFLVDLGGFGVDLGGFLIGCALTVETLRNNRSHHACNTLLAMSHP